MKKFLSLVLALVMTMSLVTISAGATEYKDLTDKDEIQYEEAVAVLNRIGIITGYEDGTFRPETELTRGAAAKIIVSLMIGPDAASALPNNESPYPDVPAGHTFAGVIGYCKTAGYISGYSDGTFKPANSLTGYAFSKMLLGALGYKSDLENFTGTGWTMNVARLGNSAGLFNRLSFNGADAVNREEACQLALNTLKATMVEYTGGFTITTGDAAIVGDKTRTYVTSNQSYAKNIDNRKAENQGNAKDDHFTVEFGEEHFKDLRLNDEHVDARDSFGRPSNEWSFKKVTIGTFPIAADFTFDKQMAHVDKTDAVKNRATGLSGYDLENDEDAFTAFWINGVKYELDTNGKWDSDCPDTYSEDIANGKDAKIANINDLTDNGTVVEVYVSEDDADFITDVVVVQTQLMEVRRVGSDYVSLQREDDDDPDSIKNNAYNMKTINAVVDDVKVEDNAYSVLSELKEGDVVAVIPVAQDSDPSVSTKYDVSEAYVPETVKGALTAVETYGTLTASDKDPVNVTVGGSVYPIALWSRDLKDIDGDAVKMTRKDVTLYLDKNGNALKAEDVGSTDGWMVIGRYYEDVVDRHLVTMVEGWDTSGEKLELNIGNFRYNYTGNTYRKGYAPGDLVRYESTTKGNAEWEISVDQGKNHVVPVDVDAVDAYTNDRIEKSDVRIPLTTHNGSENVYVDSTGIKFVFVTYESDGSGDVESVEIKKGVQEVSVDELKDYFDRTARENAGEDESDSCYTSAQAGYTTKAANNWDADQVKVVVVKSESNDAEATNLMYIRDQVGGATKLSDGTMVYHYTVVMLGPDGYFNDEVRIVSDDNVKTDTFVSYTQKEIENYSGSETCYDLRDHSNFVGRVASTFQADLFQMVNADRGFIRLANIDTVKGASGATPDPEVMKDNRGGSVSDLGGDTGVIRIYNAKFADLRSQADKRATREITSYRDLKWLVSEADASIKLDKNPADGYIAVGEETLELQIIVNDKVGNANFREAALVIVTDKRDAVATVPQNGDAGLGLTIGGQSVSFTKTSDTTFTADFEYDVADVSTAVAVVGTINEKATAAVSGTATNTVAFTAGAGTGTVTLADAATLVIAVSAENGTTVTYTVTLKEVDPGEWVNPVVTEDYTDLDSYDADDWTDDVSNFAVTGGELTGAPILNTGVASEIDAQVVSCLEAMGYKNVTPLGTDDDNATRNYQAVSTTDTGAELTRTIAIDVTGLDVLYLVDDGTDVTMKAAAAGTKVNDAAVLGGSTTAIPSITEIGKEEAPIEGTLADTEVIAGATYKAEVYTAVNVLDEQDTADKIAGTAGTTADYTYTVEADSGVIVNAAGDTWYMKAGQKITVTVTIDGFDDIATTLATKTDTITIKDATGLTVAPSAGVEFDKDTDAASAELTITAPSTAVAAVTGMTVNGETANA